MNELIVAKGKKVERVDLRRGKPDKATLTRLMMGPSGNLRAPTLRVGKRILVGFDEESYQQVLG
jgi:arsenate reductase-like glutaredoxin family protein